MDKKIIITIAILLVITAGWFGYKNLTTTTTTKLYPGKIIIGYVIWPGYVGLYIADDKGYFKENGLDIHLKSYPGLVDLSKDYLAGNIQGRTNLTLDAINEAYTGLDHKVVAAIDYSNGSDGIIASKNIKEFREIKGKRVAFEYETLEEFFLRYALDQHGLGLEDIVPINLSPENSAKAMISGEADAAVTYEPFMGQALLDSGGNTIYSSANAPGLITDILTFRSDFINENRETVTAIVEAYFRAVRFWKENPAEANIIIAKRLNTTADQVPAQMQGIIVLDKAENQTAFTFAAGSQSLYGNMRNIGEFVENHRKKTDTITIDTDTLIEPAFIRETTR